MMVTVAALGCSQTNGRDEVTRESLCIGLDPASVACAREVLARIDRDLCEDVLVCEPMLDPRFCDVYHHEAGSLMTLANADQLVLVRLGRLRIDLDAAICVMRENIPCGFLQPSLCEPILVPTASFTTCTRQEECGRDGYCADTEGVCWAGVCRQRLTRGATCVAGDACALDEDCFDGICRTRTPNRRTATLGATCGSFVDGETYYFEACVEGAACSFSFTAPSTCIPVVSLGESCGPCPGPDCAGCAVTLVCDANVCAPSRLPREGDPCDSSTFGLVCEDGFYETRQTGIGDVCWVPCVEGYCAPSDDSSFPARCMATRRPNGAPCTAIDQCENGLCCNAVCVPVPE